MTQPRAGWRLSDFLTDGSLPALLEELSSLASTTITLHDLDGRRIDAADGSPPWTIGDPDALSAAIGAALADPSPEISLDPDAPLVLPVRVRGAPAGAIVAASGEEEALRVAPLLTLIARTAEAFCDENVAKRRRTEELAMLFRLSSALVARRTPEESVELALYTAMELTRADAGAIHLLDEEGEHLTLAAAVGLSEASRAELAELPRSRVIDSEVLRGEIVAEPDLAAEGRAVGLDALLGQGIGSMLSVGLIFRGGAFGLLRLYGKTGRKPTRRDGLLARSVAEQVAAAIAGARAAQAERRRRQLLRALELASSVQRRMLPDAPPSYDQLDIAWRYESSLELGGDFLDLIELDGHVGLAVGDVVGKGAPAAMLMAAARAFLRAHATDIYDVDEIIARVNRAMTRDTLDNEFATVFYGVLDPEDLRLTYCNAGHDPPFVVRPAGADFEIIELDVGGMLVGVDDTQTYDRSIFTLRPGDTLVAFTDGVTDAQNFDDQKFSRPRLVESITTRLAEDPSASAEDLAAHTHWHVRRFAGMRRPTDDFTLLIVRVRDDTA